jgi:Trypsin-co-occurring domain 1
MASDIVAYQLDDSSVVRFEIDRPAGFSPAGGPGTTKVAGKVQDAIVPVIEAAKVVLDKVRETAPDEVEVTFGVKVSGQSDWIIARAAGEANFEIKMTWRPARPEVQVPATAGANGNATADESAHEGAESK